MSGYGTTLKVRNSQVYFDTIEQAKSPECVKTAKKHARENIEVVKSRLKMMCAATPKDMFPNDDDGDPMFKMEREFNDNWEWLESEMQNEAEASVAENIIDDWSYDGIYDEIEPSYTLDPQKDWDKICPTERYEDNKILNFDDLKIKDASLDEIVARADKKFKLENYEDNIQGKFVAYYKGKMFLDIHGRYLWSSEESAINHVVKALCLYSNDYIEKSYIKDHKDVLIALKDKVDWGIKIKPFMKDDDSEMIEATPELFDEYIEKMETNEKLDYNVFVGLGEMISSALKNLVKPYITVKQI